MFSKEDILKQLRGGTAPEDIANAMAKEINTALTEYNEEVKKAEATKKEREEDAYYVVDAISDFFTKYFNMQPMTDAERKDIVNEILTLADQLLEIGFGRPTNKETTATTQNTAKAGGTETVDEKAIRAFLNSLL